VGDNDRDDWIGDGESISAEGDQSEMMMGDMMGLMVGKDDWIEDAITGTPAPARRPRLWERERGRR
jgi:hypothetical protein